MTTSLPSWCRRPSRSWVGDAHDGTERWRDLRGGASRSVLRRRRPAPVSPEWLALVRMRDALAPEKWRQVACSLGGGARRQFNLQLCSGQTGRSFVLL